MQTRPRWQHYSHSSRSFLRRARTHFAARSFNRNARDSKVLHDGDALVGLLTSTLLVDVTPSIRHFRIAIHPQYRRRGLGCQMLNIARTQNPIAPVLQCNSQRSWPAANAFLARASFCVTTELLMRLRAPAVVEADAPDGFTLRSAQYTDGAVWQALHKEAYADHADFHPLSSTDLTLAEREGEVVGYCQSVMTEGCVGAINSLVDRPAFQRRGLGAALLADGISPSHSMSSPASVRRLASTSG
jgi:ribosomal protein S18 acetylase RimI-like enzyme